MKNIHAYTVLFALSLVIQSTPVQADLNNSIYVPVEPCRVGDSRPAKITAGTSVEWLAYGDDLSSQGGAGSPGCSQPKAGMKPIGVALNVTVVGNQATGNGNVVAYPADGAIPSGSLVNYKPGTNIANSTIVGLCQDGVCDGKFRLLSNLSDVPLIADVQGYFYPAPGNVANVAKSGGDYTSPVAAMADVANWCGTPSTTNHCLVKIAPGTYDLGTSNIVMQQWVSIQGAGQDETIITGTVSTGTLDSTSAVVAGANNTSLTDLSIENTGLSTYSIAIFNGSASPQIERVTATTSGGTFNFSIYNSSSSPIMTNVTATGSGGVSNAGVYNYLSSSPIMTNVTAKGSDGLDSHGVYNANLSSPIMTNVTASALGGSNNSYGVFNTTSSSPTMINVTATGSDATFLSYGVFNANSSPVIQNSILDGETKGLAMDSGSTGTRVSNSKIVGGVADQAGTQCRGTYKTDLTDEPC